MYICAYFLNKPSAVIANILKTMNELYDRAGKSSSKRLYSDSISGIMDALQFIEAKETVITRHVKGTEYETVFYYEYLIMRVYSSLAIEYYTVCNYEGVIQIYNWFTSKFNSATALEAVTSTSNSYELMNLVMIYYELALIRAGEDTFATSFIFQNAPNYMKNAKDRGSANVCRLTILSCLRATKNFDDAIYMGMQFVSIGNLVRKEELELAVSLAITYIERYRVEFYQRSKKENKQEFVRIGQFIAHTVPTRNWDFMSYNNTELLLSHSVALAQWYYLLSKGRERGDKEWTEFRGDATFYARAFIAKKWQMKDNCFYCHQAPTEHEVKLVCGDCRVACYCSIHHQRASWKKSAVHDMCFGHEAICSAMKAYRKWQESIDSGDIEREEKMERRFGRECLGFLAYGLGLEDKCVDPEEVESGGLDV